VQKKHERDRERGLGSIADLGVEEKNHLFDYDKTVLSTVSKNPQWLSNPPIPKYAPKIAL